MPEITFLTGNSIKFEQARSVLKDTNITLVQLDMDTPEIQSTEIEEVASYSSSWAAKELGKPVVVTDVGYYFTGLKGFPGPFIKWINKWFTAEDYLRLMQGIEDRTVIIRQCLSYCEPGKSPVNFIGEVKETVAKYAGPVGIWKTPINQITIPEGATKVVGEMTLEEGMEFWNKDLIWYQFAEYLKLYHSSH